MGIINNKTSLLFTFLVIVVLLIGMTIYKVSEIHLQRSFTVTEKELSKAHKHAFGVMCVKKVVLL